MTKLILVKILLPESGTELQLGQKIRTNSKVPSKILTSGKLSGSR